MPKRKGGLNPPRKGSRDVNKAGPFRLTHGAKKPSAPSTAQQQMGYGFAAAREAPADPAAWRILSIFAVFAYALVHCIKQDEIRASSLAPGWYLVRSNTTLEVNAEHC